MSCVRLRLCQLICLAVALACCAPLTAQDGSTDDLVQLVIGLLGDADKDVRALAFDQVRTAAKGEAATRQIASQLPTLPADAQVGLLSALADRADVIARPAVLDVLATSDNEAVRVAAIEALGTLGNSADVARLVQFLASPSAVQTKAARGSLVQLRGAEVPGAIVSSYGQATPSVRIVLIEILGSRRALEAVPELLTAAVDAEPSVRAAAMTVLGQLAGPEHVSGMVRGVLRAEPGAERAAAEKTVMFVCSRIDDSEQRAAPLLAAMNSLDEDERLAIVSTLGRVGGSAALKVVEAAIANPDPSAHEIGIAAISNWPDASVASRLLELATTDEHAAHRTTALRALMRVAPLQDARTDDQRLELLHKAIGMATSDRERLLALDRARAIRTLAALEFILPYVDQPSCSEQACLSVVELAHHRGLREPNKQVFDQALDKVIQVSKNATVVDRAKRYKKGETWVRPKSK